MSAGMLIRTVVCFMQGDESSSKALVGKLSNLSVLVQRRYHNVMSGVVHIPSKQIHVLHFDHQTQTSCRSYQKLKQWACTTRVSCGMLEAVGGSS